MPVQLKILLLGLTILSSTAIPLAADDAPTANAAKAPEKAADKSPAADKSSQSDPDGDAYKPAMTDELPADGKFIPSRFWSVIYAPDGKSLLSASGYFHAGEPGELVVWDLEKSRASMVRRQEAVIRSVALSSDGKMLAIGDFSGRTRLIDQATGKITVDFRAQDKPVYAVAFSADDKLLAAGSFGGTLTLWDVETKAEQRKFELPGELVTGVAFSRDGRLLAGSTWLGRVYVWDLATGERRHALEASAAPQAEVRIVEALAFSPDSRTLATGSWDKTLRTWDMETGKVLWDFAGAEAAIHVLAFAPDGKLLATGSGATRGPNKTNSTGAVMFWDPATGVWKSTFNAHLSRCCGLAFSPDSKQLATAGWDRAVQVWDVETRSELKRLSRETRAVQRPQPVSYPRELEFFLVTSLGKPVAGATVTVWGGNFGSGKGMAFPDDWLPKYTSDAKGAVKIVLPETGDTPGVKNFLEFSKTGFRSIGITVDHPDHPRWRGYREHDKQRLVLADAGRIDVRARREGETALQPHLYPVFSNAGFSSPPSWTETDGVLTVRRVILEGEQAARWLRIVQFPEQGPAWYTEPIDLLTHEERPISLEVNLKPGVRWEGRLPEQVPRPVKRGQVAGTVLSGAGTAVNGGGIQGKWQLRALAPIAEDGTFVFESLPPGEVLQVMAVCEGWTSSPAPPAEAEAFAREQEIKLERYAEGLEWHTAPQFIRLNVPLVQGVLAMQPASHVEVTVKDDNGNPLAEAYVHAGLTPIYGLAAASYLTDDLASFRKRLAEGEQPPAKQPPVDILRNRYVAKTDERGIAVIRDLPSGPGERSFIMNVQHAAYVPASERVNGAARTVRIQPGQTGQITVRMQPKP